MLVMTSNIGIDVSGYQDEPAGDWLFVVLKTTQGLAVVNPKADAQWAYAAKYQHHGVYHYATPHAADGSDGSGQANFFADDALRRGFRKDVDIWMLDCEYELNQAVSSDAWHRFATDFLTTATARLGKVGFLYVGQYFDPPAFADLITEYPWWDPNYGTNDGQVHPLPAGIHPVLQQYTSAGNLDKSVVLDQARWNALTGAQAPAPAPQPAPAPVDTEPTLRALSTGPEVAELQRKLVGAFGQRIGVDGSYGKFTEMAVQNVQRFFHLAVDGICGPQTWAVVNYISAIHNPPVQ